MGGITSRQNAGVEEVDIGINHAYRYPPKSGNYFSSHFIMGGERFDTAQPEMYLFGENMDLNFLGSRPAPFPYPAPTANEPSKTLKALINIRKETLRFVRAPDDSATLKTPQVTSGTTQVTSGTPQVTATETSPAVPSNKFNIEFTFDCDVRCAITIMYFCMEELTTNAMIYTPRDASMNSETYHYKKGASQQFSQVCHVFDPSSFPEEELLYSFDRDILPIVIYCVAQEGEEPRQSHATFAIVEKHTDGYAIKPLKQKLFVDGLSYLLQEIYGIENKNAHNCKVSTEDDGDDNGGECVICMCDLRDTLILPCRHLCLCNCCADSLRYQASNCPICRAPFRALLQIKALQKTSNNCSNTQQQQSSEVVDGIPSGYESVSLIEALNGPSASAPVQPSAPTTLDLYVQLPQTPTHQQQQQPTQPNDTTRCFVETVSARGGGVEDSTTQTDHHTTQQQHHHSTPSSPPQHEMRMSVLLAQECEEVSCLSKGTFDDLTSNKTTTQATRNHTPVRTNKLNNRDAVKMVNEVTPKNMEMVEASETRGLLEEGERDGEMERKNPSTPPPPPPPTASAPPHDDDDNDNDDDDDDEVKSVIVVMDSKMSNENDENDSPTVTHRKKHRKGTESSILEGYSTQSSPGISRSAGLSPGLSLTNPSEPLSLPGTPLSNTSGVSRSSDASVSSASSTRALLSHNTTTTTATDNNASIV